MKWISVEDGLPDVAFEYVWVCYAFCGLQVNKGHHLRGKWWTDDEMKVAFTTVTHWTPIVPPDPPNGEKDVINELELLVEWPCQQLLGGTGAAIYASVDGMCTHEECHPRNLETKTNHGSKMKEKCIDCYWFNKFDTAETGYCIIMPPAICGKFRLKPGATDSEKAVLEKLA